MATPDPTNQSAAELARVLARANLLQYYDVFIEQGGDDVGQLCEAGDEEFLEIMALVGMASKPLHVRRLQKALQEWVSNPSLFAVNFASMTPPTPAPGSILAHVSHAAPSAYSPTSSMHGDGSTSTWSPRPASIKDGLARSQSAPQSPTHHTTDMSDSTETDTQHAAMMIIKPEPIDAVPSPGRAVVDLVSDCGTVGGADVTHTTRRSSTRSPSPPPTHADNSVMLSAENSNDSSTGGKQVPLYYYNNVLFNGGTQQDDRECTSPTPQLSDAQIQAIAGAALELSKTLPTFEPKWMNIKKSLVREIEELMALQSDEPVMRLEKIRTYSAIYGRFDSKRKNEKQMSLHEISVNEASAQLCVLVPALLTRREELFPLARQIVRESGYQYAKGHSRSSFKRLSPGTEAPVSQNSDQDSPKKAKMMDPTAFTIRPKMSKIEKEQAYKEARLQKISCDLEEVENRQAELKASIEEAKLNADYEQLSTLTEDLEEQNSRKSNLIAAQTELNRKKRPYNRKIPEHSMQGLQHDQAAMMGSLGVDHTGLIPRLDFHQFNVLAGVGPMSSISSMAGHAAALSGLAGMSAGPGLKQSLLDEGLRIATQYGMMDFAAELQGLRGDAHGVGYQYPHRGARHQASPPMRRQGAQIGQYISENYRDQQQNKSPSQHSDSNHSPGIKVSSNPDTETHSNTSTPHNNPSTNQRNLPPEHTHCHIQQEIMSPGMSPKMASGEDLLSTTAQITEITTELQPMKAECTDEEPPLQHSTLHGTMHAKQEQESNLVSCVPPPMPGLIPIKVEHTSHTPHSNGVVADDPRVQSPEPSKPGSVTEQVLPSPIAATLGKEGWKTTWIRGENTS